LCSSFSFFSSSRVLKCLLSSGHRHHRLLPLPLLFAAAASSSCSCLLLLLLLLLLLFCCSICRCSSCCSFNLNAFFALSSSLCLSFYRSLLLVVVRFWLCPNLFSSFARFCMQILLLFSTLLPSSHVICRVLLHCYLFFSRCCHLACAFVALCRRGKWYKTFALCGNHLTNTQKL